MASGRKCKHCDRWITFRLMPHGRYVAFENNEPHDCSRVSPSKTVRPPPRPPLTGKSSSPGDFEFEDIVVKDTGTSKPDKPSAKVSRPEVVSPKPSIETEPPRRPAPTPTHRPAAPPVTYSPPRDEGNAGWPPWLILLLVILALKAIYLLSR